MTAKVYEDVTIMIKVDARPDQKELQDALRGLRVTRHILPGYGEETARLWNWIEAALAYAAGEYHWGNDHFRRLAEAGKEDRERQRTDSVEQRPIEGMAESGHLRSGTAADSVNSQNGER